MTRVGFSAKPGISEAEAAALIAAHAGVSDAHHTKPTFTELAGGENHNTSSGTWEDWDVSTIVPAGTKSVLVGIGREQLGAQTTVGVRKNGTALERKNTVGAGVGTEKWCFCCLTEVDASRIIELYNGANDNYTWFNILGYWS